MPEKVGSDHGRLRSSTAAMRLTAASGSKAKSVSRIAAIRRRRRCAASWRARSRRKAPTIWSVCAGAHCACSNCYCEKFELIAHLQNMPKDQNIDDIGALIDGAGAPNIPKLHHHRPMRSDNLCDLLFRQSLFPLPRVALAEKRLGGLRPLIEAAFGLLPGQRREGGFFDRHAKLHRARFETQKARQTREAAFRCAASRSS